MAKRYERISPQMIAQERSKYRQKNVFRIILPIPLEIVGRQGILQHPREDYMIIGSKDSMVSSAAMLFVYLSFYYLSAHQNSIPLLKNIFLAHSNFFRRKLMATQIKLCNLCGHINLRRPWLNPGLEVRPFCPKFPQKRSQW